MSSQLSAIHGEPSARRRGLLVYNPTAGQRNRGPQMLALIERMRREGIELINSPTVRRGHATEMVQAILPERPDVVVVCGGDGTISEVACGLVGSSVPLAILPGGTSNVLARELEIPLAVSEAADLILRGTARPVRVMLANERPFLLWAGVGLDARIMGHMSVFWKRWLGRTGIFFTVAPEFFKYEFPKLAVRTDGETHEATFAVVCHARLYAGTWVIAPEASLDSEDLDVVLFSGTGRWRFLSLFRQLQLARSGHLERGIARVVRAREVEIRSLEDYPVEVQVDGDCVLETPITCRPSDQTVQILVPPKSQHAR